MQRSQALWFQPLHTANSCREFHRQQDSRECDNKRTSSLFEAGKVGLKFFMLSPSQSQTRSRKEKEAWQYACSNGEQYRLNSRRKAMNETLLFAFFPFPAFFFTFLCEQVGIFQDVIQDLPYLKCRDLGIKPQPCVFETTTTVIVKIVDRIVSEASAHSKESTVLIGSRLKDPIVFTTQRAVPTESGLLAPLLLPFSRSSISHDSHRHTSLFLRVRNRLCKIG